MWSRGTGIIKFEVIIHCHEWQFSFPRDEITEARFPPAVGAFRTEEQQTGSAKPSNLPSVPFLLSLWNSLDSARTPWGHELSLLAL